MGKKEKRLPFIKQKNVKIGFEYTERDSKGKTYRNVTDITISRGEPQTNLLMEGEPQRDKINLIDVRRLVLIVRQNSYSHAVKIAEMVNGHSLINFEPIDTQIDKQTLANKIFVLTKKIAHDIEEDILRQR